MPGRERLYTNRPLPEAPSPSSSNPSNPPILTKLATTEVQQNQLPHTPVTTPLLTVQAKGTSFEKPQVLPHHTIRSPPSTPKETSSFEVTEANSSRVSETPEQKSKRENTIRLRELTLAQLENCPQSPVDNSNQEGAGDPEDDSFTFRLDEDFSVLSFARDLGLPVETTDAIHSSFHYHQNNHSTPHDSISRHNEATFNIDAADSSVASRSLSISAVQSPQEPSNESYTTSSPVSDFSAIASKSLQEEPNIKKPTYSPDAPTEARPQAKTPNPGPVSPSKSRPRHICRECSKPIFGKSVASADGQLTGRWHKDCFKCTKCSQSFPTGNFYVYANAPYCSYHYHEINGSLCRVCDQGIEGQYIESDCRPAGVERSVEIKKSAKYHAECFNCYTCKKPLSDDYFAWNGFAYCEHHAETIVMQDPLSFAPPADMPPDAFVSPRPAPPPPSASPSKQRAPVFPPPPSLRPRGPDDNLNLNPNLPPNAPRRPTGPPPPPPSPTPGYPRPNQHHYQQSYPLSNPSSFTKYPTQPGSVAHPLHARSPVDHAPGPNGRLHQHRYHPSLPASSSSSLAATLPSHGPHGSRRPQLNLGDDMPTHITGGPNMGLNPKCGTDSELKPSRMPERRTTVLLAQ